MLSLGKRRKATLQELQSLIGLLNFACRAIIQGRTFLRRLIDLTMSIKKPHHFRNLSVEARADIVAWQIFIESFNGRTFFLSNIVETSEKLQLYTDASDLGMGVFSNLPLNGLNITSQLGNVYLS